MPARRGADEAAERRRPCPSAQQRRDALARTVAGFHHVGRGGGVLGVGDRARSRASIQRAGNAVIGERRGDDPAADQFADGMHRVARPRRHFAQHRQRVHQAVSSSNSRLHLGEHARRGCCSSRAVATDEWRSSSVRTFRGAPCPARRPRRARAIATSESVTFASADTTTTRRAASSSPAAARTMPISAVDGVGIGDRGPAEFHHHR